ncbi:tetratricopeptide repeat protein [Coleofasciculus sp. FACHB-129]|uniref:tetratricopeptide repeat protein n=1 Tax=Cyanophyceae TaxID=3028117 RepID=UPI001684762C|nr:tetratricopeptide repeat protein [Coleofasciculus sp. FACHB-129]MBD1894931.1 tetratricopeptide repeat protein [Coleofasciculus sp. FACHB-129]
MKRAEYYKSEILKGELSGRFVRKRWWIPLLVALPIAGVLVGWRLWNPSAELDAPYRYPFSQSPSDNITTALGREIAFYQERIRRNPGDGLDRTSLAKAYLKMARATGDANWYLMAEQSAKRSLANLSFDNQGAILVLARIAEAKHDFTEAIRLAKQVLQTESGNEDALSLLVTSNLAMGKVDEANRVANALVDKIPTLGSLTLRALVKVAQGQDAAAIQDFQQALAAEEPGETGSSAWTRTLLGRFYFQRGNHQLAKELYQEVLRILPRYPLALVNLAELETRLGQYRAAERHYSQVFVSPTYQNVFDHVALQGMARVKHLQGDQSGAQELWDKAEALIRQHQNITSFGHRRELARLLLARGRSEDLAEALSLMQAEVAIRRDAETLDTLAWALCRSERWRKAQQVVAEALGRGTRDAGIFARAGTIEQALGNNSQAIAYFQKAQEIDPTFDEQTQRSQRLNSNFATEVNQ